MGGGTSAARRVAEVASEALQATDAQDVMRRVTTALLEAVGADSAMYHEFDIDGWGAVHERGSSLEEPCEAAHRALAPPDGPWPVVEHCLPVDVCAHSSSSR